MKFMNVIKKFKSHQDYLDYRNGLLDEAEKLLSDGDMDGYKEKVEDVKAFDDEYASFQEEQANMDSLRGAHAAPHALAPAAAGQTVDMFQQSGNTDDREYRMAFMNYVLAGTEIPQNLMNESQVTVSTDVGAVIPNTVLNKIIEKMETVGTILNKVTRTFYKGGVTVPTSAAKPVATWTTERGTSDKQKKATGSITFSYHKLRCVVAVSIAVENVTLEVFERTITQNIADAMVKGLEEAIIKGSGTNEPTGILKETPVEEQVVSLTPGKNVTYADLCAVEAAVPEEYENGAEWYMPKKTFFNQIVSMTDSNGQPIARTNVGINGKPEYTILGRKVNFCKYVPAFTKTVTENTVVGFVFNMEDYMLNTNLNVTVKKYEDHDTDDQMTKAIMLADGKVVDNNSLVELQIKKA